jgi:hypothetical protein
MLRNFSADAADVAFLKHLYGSDSIIYRKAKSAADASGWFFIILSFISHINPPIAIEVRQNLSLGMRKTVLSDGNLEVKKVEASPLDAAEKEYWDIANCVLMHTKTWEHLPSSMQRYESM